MSPVDRTAILRRRAIFVATALSALLASLVQIVASDLSNHSTQWEPEIALAIVDELRRGGVAEARMALTILSAAAQKLHFNAACSERLRALRNHPQLSVRLPALSLFTAAE